MRHSLCRIVLALGFTALASQTAEAAEVTRVASSFEEGNIFDFHFGVAYEYNFKRAAILREWNSGSPQDRDVRLVKDLMYQQQRHTVTPTLEFGLWHDLALYTSMPIVVWDSREYSFDQRADDCVFGEQPEATCVDKGNSTAVRDGIIPLGGVDGTNPSAAFSQFQGPNTQLIFRGPVRRGLDQLHFGLKYGILNQDKRAHMPNWVIGVEGRIAVGKAMTFSRNMTANRDPDGNHRVGRRIHEFGAWTALSRRYRFLDPYFTAHWRQSVRASGSKFQDFSSAGSQSVVQPQSSAGMQFGAEIVPWERKAKHLKVAVELGGNATLHYGGRGYSEVWELLADSPALAGSFAPGSNAPCNREAALDFAEANPGDPGYLAAGGPSGAATNCKKFEGVTDLQDYATFGFRGGLNLHLGKYVRLGLGALLNTDTRHFVTFAGRGKANGSGSDPDRVEPGTNEVNPVRRDVVDNVGRRFVIDDVLDVRGYFRLLITI